jgi:hypothetical protein
MFASTVLLSVCAVTQTPPPEARTLAVSVVDREGKPVPKLAASNFRGEFRGEPVKILAATVDQSPRRIALVVDTSAGMGKDATRWRFAWDAAEDLVLSLAPVHEIVFLTVADKLWQHTKLLSDPKALQSALQEAREREAAGATALYDGVIQASRGFSSPGLGDAICLVTDGVDNVSTQTASEVETAVARAGLRLFVVWITPMEGYTAVGTEIRYGRPSTERTDRIAETSGGFVLRPRSYKPDQVGKELAPLRSRLTYVYRLDLEFPETINKPRKWKLEVVDANGKKRRNVAVSYPRLLVPSQD